MKIVGNLQLKSYINFILTIKNIDYSSIKVTSGLNLDIWTDYMDLPITVFTSTVIYIFYFRREQSHFYEILNILKN